MLGIHKTAIFAASMLATASQATQDTCRALVLSGGGNNGSWEIGVLWGMLNYGDPADFAFDVITGVSAGSINTAALAGWPVGQEAEAAQWMSDLWKNLHTTDIWVDWPLGKVSGLTLMPGAVDDSPLYLFLTEQLKQFEDYGRRVTLSSVNVETGINEEFTQKNIEFWELPDAAVSSASIPVVFPPHVWSRGTFMDGGTVLNINLEGAIHQCLDLVDDESKIIIDVYICGADSSPTTEEKSGNGWENYFRGRALHKFYNSTNQVASTMKAFPTVDFRYIMYQNEGHMGGLNEINFEGDFTWPAQQ